MKKRSEVIHSLIESLPKGRALPASVALLASVTGGVQDAVAGTTYWGEPEVVAGLDDPNVDEMYPTYNGDTFFVTAYESGVEDKHEAYQGLQYVNDNGELVPVGVPEGFDLAQPSGANAIRIKYPNSFSVGEITAIDGNWSSPSDPEFILSEDPGQGIRFAAPFAYKAGPNGLDYYVTAVWSGGDFVYKAFKVNPSASSPTPFDVKSIAVSEGARPAIDVRDDGTFRMFFTKCDNGQNHWVGNCNIYVYDSKTKDIEQIEIGTNSSVDPYYYRPKGAKYGTLYVSQKRGSSFDTVAIDELASPDHDAPVLDLIMGGSDASKQLGRAGVTPSLDMDWHHNPEYRLQMQYHDASPMVADSVTLSSPHGTDEVPFSFRQEGDDAYVTFDFPTNFCAPGDELDLALKVRDIHGNTSDVHIPIEIAPKYEINLSTETEFGDDNFFHLGQRNMLFYGTGQIPVTSLGGPFMAQFHNMKIKLESPSGKAIVGIKDSFSVPGNRSNLTSPYYFLNDGETGTLRVALVQAIENPINIYDAEGKLAYILQPGETAYVSEDYIHIESEPKPEVGPQDTEPEEVLPPNETGSPENGEKEYQPNEFGQNGCGCSTDGTSTPWGPFAPLALGIMASTLRRRRDREATN